MKLLPKAHLFWMQFLSTWWHTYTHTLSCQFHTDPVKLCVQCIFYFLFYFYYELTFLLLTFFSILYIENGLKYVPKRLYIIRNNEKAPVIRLKAPRAFLFFTFRWIWFKQDSIANTSLLNSMCIHAESCVVYTLHNAN